MKIEQYLESSPSLTFETEEHVFSKQEIQMPKIRWGDVSFGTLPDGIDDADTWIHEFTEDTIGDLLNLNGVDVGTFAQIIGSAAGFSFWYHGVELQGYLDYILTSLVLGTNIPTPEGDFAFLNADEFIHLLPWRNPSIFSEEGVGK